MKEIKVRLPEEVKRKLRMLAAEGDVSTNSLVTIAVERYLMDTAKEQAKKGKQ